MEGVALGLRLGHAGRRLQIFRLVEAVAEALAGLLDFLLDLLVVFSYLVLDEHIGTIALLRVAVVNQGVVEGIDVAGGLPDGGVHEDGRVNAHDVLVEQHHRLPPVLLDVVFQLYAHLAVIIDCAQSVVDVT